MDDDDLIEYRVTVTVFIYPDIEDKTRAALESAQDAIRDADVEDVTIEVA